MPNTAQLFLDGVDRESRKVIDERWEAKEPKQ
jgi:hypothetical protein